MFVFKKIRNFYCSTLICLVLHELASAAQISEADLVALSKQDLDNDSERLFEYVKTTSEGIRLGCKGKVRKGDTGKVQALFIEDSTGRRELKRLAPVSAKYKNYLNVEEDKYVPLRDFPMYCLERVFTSSSCPPGPPGRPGIQGRNGNIGQPGSPGLPGPSGFNGYDAIPGPPGPQGPPGDTGLRGERGPNGLRGEPGPKGSPGEPGQDGKDGMPGLPGLPGENGAPGTPGVNGVDGIDGQDGPPGPAGNPGPSGLPGPDGLPGIPGIIGNSGFNGIDGIDGQNGISGSNGMPGTCCSGTDEVCPEDDENLGLSPEDDVSENHIESHSPSSSSSVVESEEENVKNRPSAVNQKPGSFWLSNSDIFSIGNMEFKNVQKNKAVKENSEEEAEASVEDVNPQENENSSKVDLHEGAVVPPVKAGNIKAENENELAN